MIFASRSGNQKTPQTGGKEVIEMDGEIELPACKECGSHMWVGDESGLCEFCERAAPIKKQRDELAHRYGFCIQCNQEFEFDPHEPFAYCKCGTTEWGSNRPKHVDLIMRLQVDNERMRCALKIIENNCAELCSCHEGPSEEFIECDVSKTKGYTLAHAFSGCHDECPTKQEGIRLIDEAKGDVS